MKIGIHCSTRHSLVNSLDEAQSLRCNTMQIFTRSPLRWLRRDIGPEEIKEFNARRLQYGITPLVIHIPYLPNLATSNKELFNKSIEIFRQEVSLSDNLSADYLVFHPGAYSMDSTAQEGMDRIIKAVNLVLDPAAANVMLLLENVSGGGRRLGASFEELTYILDRINKKKNIGICLDTAHLIAAGYPLSDKQQVYNTISTLDRAIGIKHIKVIHLNDSLVPCGSRRDRHQHIGRGAIGKEGFRAFLNHSKIRNIPMILETPKDSKTADRNNLQAVRKLAK